MFFILTAIGVFCGDQFLKKQVEDGKLSEGREFLKGNIVIKKHVNKGLILNKFENEPKWVLAVVSAVFGAAVFMYLMTLGKKRRRVKRFGLALAIGGAASNLYDRIVKGGVTDFAGIKPLKGIVANLGDAAVLLGSFISFIGSLWSED